MYLSPSVCSGVSQDERLLALEIEARVGRLRRAGRSVIRIAASVDEDLSGFGVDPEFFGAESAKGVFHLAETAGVGVGGRDLA